MPRLISRLLASPRAKQRAHFIAAGLLGLVAVVTWWSVADDGATPARVITAIASTAAAILEALLPKRRRLFRRAGSARPRN